MSITDCILIALFLIAVVFSVLISLWVLIRVFSMVVGILEKSKKGSGSTTK